MHLRQHLTFFGYLFLSFFRGYGADDNDVLVAHVLENTEVGGFIFSGLIPNPRPHTPVCDYKLTTDKEKTTDDYDDEEDDVFGVKLTDSIQGLGSVVVKKEVDYEKKSVHHYVLHTVFCNPALPEHQRKLEIRVVDLNDNPPRWTHGEWVVRVKEGRLYDPLLIISAVDDDASDEYNKICQYKLYTPDVPFVVDYRGHIKNTKPLDYNTHHNYILEFKAYDCEGLASEKVFVTVLIGPNCRRGWKGLPKSIAPPLPGEATAFMKKIKNNNNNINNNKNNNNNDDKLISCADTNCTISDLKVHIQLVRASMKSIRKLRRIADAKMGDVDGLEVKEIDTRCDMSYRVESDRNAFCGYTSAVFELLNPKNIQSIQNNNKNNNNNNSNNNNNNKTNDGAYYFDGLSTGYRVNNLHLPGPNVTHDKRLLTTKSGPDSKLLVATWIKRSLEDATFNGSQKGSDKQAVFCSADSEGMNRRHVSLYLHNCHLVLLTRFEPPAQPSPHLHDDGEEDYEHSEWHWKLGELCDDKWHYYSIVVERHDAKLFVDGFPFQASSRNPVIIDDRVIHHSSRVPDVVLTVGACWKGHTATYGDFLRGSLAGLVVSRDTSFGINEFRCIRNCFERFSFHSKNSLDPGVSVAVGPFLRELSIYGTNSTSVYHFLSAIKYYNPNDVYNYYGRNKRNNGDKGVGGDRSVGVSGGAGVGEKGGVDRFGGALVGDKIMSISEDAGSMKKKAGPVYKGGVKTKRDVEGGKDGNDEVDDGTVEWQEESDKDVWRSVIMVSTDAICRQKSGWQPLSRRFVIVRSYDDAEEDEEEEDESYDSDSKDDMPNGEATKTEKNGHDDDEKEYTTYGDKRPEVGYHGDVMLKDGLYQNVVSNFKHNTASKSTGTAGVVATVAICTGFLMAVIFIGVYRILSVKKKDVRVQLYDNDNKQSSITITVNPFDQALIKPSEEKEKGTEITRTNQGADDDDDDIGSYNEMLRDEEYDVEDDDDASKINHFIISDNEGW